MADGHHIEKWINCYISATVRPISMKFCMLTHTGPPNLRNVQKINFWQIQAGGRPPFWKTSNAISLEPFERFWWNLVGWCILAVPTWWETKNSKISKSKMADGGHLKNRKITISHKLFGRFWRNFARWHILILQSLPADQKIKLLKMPRWRTAAILNKWLCYGRGTARRACQ